MEIAYNILVILHFVGLASLLGGVMVQFRPLAAGKGVVNAAMFHGVLTQLVTGLLMVGIAEMGDGDVNHMKIGIKLAVLIVITVLVFIYRRRQNVASWVVWLIGALTVANIAIAVLV